MFGSCASGEVAEGRKSYRPEVVVVVDAHSHFVLATELAKPGKTHETAAAVLRGALAATAAPARIRVATRELRDALDGFDVEIVVGDTREANEVFAALEAHLEQRSENTDDSYLHGDTTATGARAVLYGRGEAVSRETMGRDPG